MLILDFDGVICDSLDECALVTWFGVHPLPAHIDVTTLLDTLPLDFRDAFAAVRPHSRTLADFVVAHDIRGEATPSDVQAALSELSPRRASQFHDQATAARERLRTEHRDWWLGLHHLYPGIGALLGRHHGHVLVVTAKDAASAKEVLRHHHLAGAVRAVIGDCHDKPAAIAAALGEQFGTSESGQPLPSLFVDDNLANALAVAESGVAAGWATWGYHTADDVARAQRLPVALARIERADDVPDLTRRREPV